MRSILEDLYYGRINASERKIYPTEEHNNLVNKINAEFNFFLEKLSEEDAKRLTELKDLIEDMTSDASGYREIEIFSYGFSLGATLAMDVVKCLCG